MTIKERIKKIYEDYLNLIVPLIEQYEVLENEFPVGVLNEIRALFTHMAKASNTQGKICSKEVGKAEGHITRLLRDCYKYNCVALEKKYREYISSLADELRQSNQMSELIIIHDSAIDSLFMAKCLEGSVSSYEKEKEIYDHYEEAYKSYIEVIERLKRLISKSI